MIRSSLDDFGSAEGLRGEDVGGEGMGDAAKFSSERLKALFEIGPKLGEGSYGLVYRAVRKSTGETVAIKRQSEDLDYEAVDTEIASFKTLGKHPNVICLQEVIREEENDLVYFVLDIMDLSLADTVKRMAEQGLSFSESEDKSVWLQCLKGLRHVHKVGLAHCDLAARNILVDRRGSVKITDFGSAIQEGVDVFFSQRDDLIDLGAVFIYCVSQEEVDEIDAIHGKISSSGVQFVEQLYSGEVSLLKAIKSRYFRQKPLPQRPQISHILSVSASHY
ncbi:cyclin-dependent kinase 5 homolog [Oratosquilla oratoria]|uniref:cyclin-dependent kinase 5 homolog n=1 Tax=Oratosquilla oratoria TaxID=337810 RepID=UPI003F75AF56